ncbi:MAG: aspartate aminotransferase family protein [Chitinophagaceae bacterium]|nr:MAG: aspartate aminotransferase family protein [Chitinophagaceae bacterium]
MNQRELFLRHIGQTSPAPLCLEIVKAEGSVMWDKNGREYLDLIAGISVCNVGHRHPKVVRAIRKQADQYLHLLVYGEMVETPQVQYAKALTSHLPPSLNTVYFTNSGAEATEGAMKLAKRVTGRSEIIAFNQSYHGSTQGALSIMGDEYWRNAFRPLLPGVLHETYNSPTVLDAIGRNTACVIMETVQAERGVIEPDAAWLAQVRARCNETGTLLIMDEIQTGFGRTGTLWGFEKYGVIPDIILLGKALGGGMPLGAFVAEKQLMDAFTLNPVLGHITTFGGHPVSCAAGLAAFKVLLKEELTTKVAKKQALFHELLDGMDGCHLRSAGMLMALEFKSFEINKMVIDKCLAEGLLTDWFLFAPQCMRIAPPLTMLSKEIRKACGVIQTAIRGL